MLTRTIFLWAGAIWGIGIGLVAAALAAAAAFVLVWALVLGDHHWPATVGLGIGAVALVAGAAGFAGAMSLARVYTDRADDASPAKVRRHAVAWLASGIGVCCAVVLGAGLWREAERAEAERARAAEMRFDELASAVHVPTLVTVHLTMTVINVDLHTQGRRAGPYRLTTRLVGPVADRTLTERTEIVQLDGAAYRRTVTFETAPVLEAFRRRLMGGGIGSVNQHLVAEVILEPVLAASEEALVAGRMPLRRSVRAATKLAFVAAADGNRLVP
jgi:hypothetical protein